ncbi:Kelch-type beta propeller [Corchorus olitorius]|uniref:Kelch-type beta propeller n=1 Tax=Corchorus olitorius TaxID=93759 RepID=A0A1R3J676_9ROSI|nr:Kelch-type beta propeller [Corchorus olitorius]
MAHSHLGMVTDGRYIYVVTGQYGPQCRGPTAHTIVLDTETKTWQDLPPLPVPRYAPATQLWRGRLHVMGGSEPAYTWIRALEYCCKGWKIQNSKFY